MFKPPIAHIAGHAEVVRALHDPRLVPIGHGDAGDGVHLAVIAAFSSALSPERVALWRGPLAAQAHRLVQALPEHEPVDLVSALAEPWCLQAAVLVTGLPHHEAAGCAAISRRLFAAAADTGDGTPTNEALTAASTLAQRLASVSSDLPLADVQTFVALTQTLPALLARAWLTLVNQPLVLADLLARPSSLPRLMPELLRLGSPSEAVFREAREGLVIGETVLRRGERIALRLGDANRDPAHFEAPDRLDASRAASAPLGFGAGPHRCAGAALAHQAMMIVTASLIARCETLVPTEDAGAVPWQGGFAIRAPARVCVLIEGRRAPCPA
jgi:cytochrome P450